MSDNFKYQWKCRSTRQRPAMEQAIVKRKELLGAGSGGDAGDGCETHYTDGHYMIGGSKVFLTALGSEGGDAESPVISILAGTGSAPDGLVNARGSQGVRITSGPPGQPPSQNRTINGLDLQTGDAQEINIMRGWTEPAVQLIQMNPGQIVIDAGPGTLTLLAATSISIKVAGGTSSISLTPLGIVMQGPVITLN